MSKGTTKSGKFLHHCRGQNHTGFYLVIGIYGKETFKLGVFQINKLCFMSLPQFLYRQSEVAQLILQMVGKQHNKSSASSWKTAVTKHSPKAEHRALYLCAPHRTENRPIEEPKGSP